MKKNSLLPFVSFIIPTLNAAGILEKCLTAIREQDYPQEKVEIIIADGGSTDNTRDVARKFGAKVIHNPEVLHEPGKSLASRQANGKIFFYTDADNILSHTEWLNLMIKPYLDNKNVQGFLPQTVPAPDTNPIDRYLGFLFTDPFTWFIYGSSANPKDYESVYTPYYKTKDYILYRFPENNFPLFGFSQGVGVVNSFQRGESAHADDILAGMKLIREHGLIAYVPDAGIYHYHVNGISNFISKYKWRIRNNLTQHVKGMGINNRTAFFDRSKKIRILLFLPYTLSIIFPAVDGVKLTYKYNDLVMLLHPVMCLLMSLLIITEGISFLINKNVKPGVYK